MDIVFREYARVTRQNKGYFFLVLSGLVIATVLNVYTPVFYKNIANGFAQPYSDKTLSMMLENFWMVMLFYVGIWLSWRAVEIGIIPVEGGGMQILDKRCFAVLKQQKYDFFENQFSGSLIKQAGRFSRAYEIIMDWFLFQFIQNVLGISIAFVLFYQQQSDFAWYFLIWIVVFIVWIVGYSIWKLKYDKVVAERDSKLGGAYSDAITNIFIVKSFALEQHEQSNINNKADATYRSKRTAIVVHTGCDVPANHIQVIFPSWKRRHTTLFVTHLE